MDIPLELINKILIMRPPHPTSIMITEYFIDRMIETDTETEDDTINGSDSETDSIYYPSSY